VSCLRERVLAARAAELEGPAPDGLPLPPARLRVLVDGSGTPEGFLAQSDVHARLIRDTLASADVHLERLGAILDFGCGCGRTARRWASLSGPELHGCDYNPQLVAWCREHLPFMEARVNALEPPAPYPDESLDLVYALSILTHLPDDLAHGWVAEWARILKPGGLLLVTTHGDAYRPALGRRAGPRYDAGQAVVVGSRMAGANACTAHHPPSYVTERLLTAFEPVAFVPGGSVPHFRQDVHLARLRST
jgi:SAM-dependent methyltransferase